MSTQSRRDLQTRIKELETENEELQSRLDEISDIVAPVEEAGRRGRRIGGIAARSEYGASWRKPTHEITDRAKRYRANAPDCRPPLPARCALCNSTRFVVVDHIDGDESNGAPDNLRWLCKSCNTKLGKAMARAGKGKRTRQYNPGARTLAQYTEAVIAAHPRPATTPAEKRFTTHPRKCASDSRPRFGAAAGLAVQTAARRSRLPRHPCIHVCMDAGATGERNC